MKEITMFKKIILCALTIFIIYPSQDKNQKHEIEKNLDEAHKKDQKNIYASLHEVIQAGNVGAFEELLPKMQNNKEDIKPVKFGDGVTYNITPLMVACHYGYYSMVDKLIKIGVAIDKQDETNGSTALMWAAQQGHADIVELLLNAGADVNKQNNNGDTALIFATDKGHTAIAELLLKARANINKQNQYDTTALMLAASHGHTAIV